MSKKLTLVVPCRNEFLRLKPELYLSALEQYEWLSFCFVNDGSTDKTGEVLDRIEKTSSKVHVISLAKNIGKAEAVRTGMLFVCKNTSADALGYWDADLAAPLSEAERFMKVLASMPRCKAVIGSRAKRPGASIRRTFKRKVTSFIMRGMIRFLLHSPVFDTQCGAKVFTRELASEIFEKPFISKWLFDVELLRRIGKKRFRSSVRILPLKQWHDVPGSNLGFKDSLQIFCDLFKIAFRSKNA